MAPASSTLSQNLGKVPSCPSADASTSNDGNIADGKCPVSPLNSPGKPPGIPWIHFVAVQSQLSGLCFGFALSYFQKVRNLRRLRSCLNAGFPK